MKILNNRQNSIQIINADVMDGLSFLLDESVDCVVTSPPYWGLRDYGTASWVGGNPKCDHKTARNGSGRADGVVDDRAQRSCDGVGSLGGYCRKCGARRVDQQLGLEQTPEDYIARMVEVFREVRRVLSKDGVLWLNIGDSYARDPGKGGSGPNGKHDHIPDYGSARKIMNRKRLKSETHGSGDGKVGRGDRAAVRVGGSGLKAKDLVGIPWMLAFALRADGWYLRQDIIWNKPNAMPESVRDRCTKSHEYIFMLTKNERYYFDNIAILEDATTNAPSKHWTKRSYDQSMLASKQQMGVKGRPKGVAGYSREGKRNKRDVWSIPTKPFKGAHFAVFPPAIPNLCISAGSRMGDVVLDPFMGSGTTLLEANALCRYAIGIELNPSYVKIARARLSET